MAGIQQVRYDMPTQPTPGFMDYAAQFLSNYMGAKAEKKEQTSKELMTLLPALAAQGQIKPGGNISFGGQQIGITGKPEDTQDQYRKMQIYKSGLELGLPGYEPTETYLQNTAWDEADKQLNRNTMYQLYSISPDTKKRALAEEIKKSTAQQLYQRMKTGGVASVAQNVPPPNVPPATDYDKKQLKKGNVLIWRNGVKGQVPADEVLPTDYRY